MPHELLTDEDDWLNLLDLDAIADPSDKLAECQYFLGLAVEERDKDKFRWLISAFFGAAYSFFEINALRAYQGFFDPETGDPIENLEAIAALGGYVCVIQDAKRPKYVKTSGRCEITKKLYELRRANTHYYPLSITTNGPQIPEDFQFGYLSGKGVPALHFCGEVMTLIREVENELQKHY